jgi:hypothetical protein
MHKIDDITLSNMRYLSSLAIFCLCISACSPVVPSPNSPIITASEIPPVASPVAAPVSIVPPPPHHPSSKPQVSQKNISNIRFDGVSFDSRTHSLLVIDQAKGPGSEYFDSKQVANSHQALLAINAGFFTPEGSPLGLVISQGKRSGTWNSASSLGTGIYRIDPSGRASISRRSSLSTVSNSTELLQAGPLLIENSQAIRGLETTKSAMRSILLHDGGHRWWIGITSPCTLAQLSQALDSGSPTHWNISHALNLDGGRSTDLFVSSKIPGGNFQKKNLMNRQVRNFLILKPKK